jgi:hypothetical protein
VTSLGRLLGDLVAGVLCLLFEGFSHRRLLIAKVSLSGLVPRG